jgi:hypothetical protein
LNGLLEAEADRLFNAGCYERSQGGVGVYKASAATDFANRRVENWSRLHRLFYAYF